MKQRTDAARLLRAGRVLVDGAGAKPAHAVRAGEILTLDADRGTGEWEVLEVPAGNVSKGDRPRYVRRLR